MERQENVTPMQCRAEGRATAETHRKENGLALHCRTKQERKLMAREGVW